MKIYPNDVILKNTDFTLGSKLATKETIFLHSDSKLVARVKLWCLHVDQYFLEIILKEITNSFKFFPEINEIRP